MLSVAAAALLVLAANAEAAAINQNYESRDTHDSDGSYEHKRGFYYLDLHGKKINDDSSWAPSWSSYRDAHPAEPSYIRPPAYKEYHVPQMANKYNDMHGTIMKRDTTPKTAQSTKPTTSTRRKRSVRSVQSRPTHKPSYRRRQKRSSGDGDETLMRLADALALVTHSLLSQDGTDREIHLKPTEKPAQEQEEADQKQEEPEAIVEDEPEDEEVDSDVKHEGHDHDEDDEEEEFKDEDNEVDPDGEVESDVKHEGHDHDEEEEFKDDDEDDEVDPKDDEVSEDEEDLDDEVDPKDDDEVDEDDEVDHDDEVDTKDDEEDPEEDNKPETKSRRSKKKSKKSKKSRKPKKKSKKPRRKSKKPKKKSEDHDMDTMDSDMDYYGADGYSDYEPPRRKYRSPAFRYKRSAGMTRMDSDIDYYYGDDGYPDYTHEHPQQSRKYMTRKPRPSYMHHHRRHKRSAGSSRSQLKYRMSPEARFRRMLSAAGQKRRNNHTRIKKYYYM